jgi:hypothetical protein
MKHDLLLFYVQCFTLACIVLCAIMLTIAVWNNAKAFRALGVVMRITNDRLTRLEGICGLSADEWREATKDYPDAWFKALFNNTPGKKPERQF